MDSTIINMGGNRPLRFILAIEKDMLTPSWMTTVDKIWLRVVADALYKAIKGHIFLCVNKNLDNPKDFAATMNISSFKNMILSGEAQRFQDMVMTLINFTIKNHITPSTTIYISFLNDDNSQHAVNAIVELAKGIIMFGANVDDRLYEASRNK